MTVVRVFGVYSTQEVGGHLGANVNVGGQTRRGNFEDKKKLAPDMPISPLKIAPSHGEIWTPSNTWFLRPLLHESTSQTISRSVQSYLLGS